MKAIYFSLLLTLPLLTFSQNTFEKAHITTTKGEKLDVFVKNWDWINSSKTISYKSSMDSKIVNLPVEDIMLYEIPSKGIRTERFTVEIDWENENRKEDNASNYQEESILLNYLVDGEIDLLEHGRSQRYFFYRKGSETPKLLVSYRYTENNLVQSNAKYREQLYSQFKCASIGLEVYKKLPYSRKKLTDIFEKVNVCQNATFKSYETKKPLGVLKMSVNGGITSMALEQSVRQENGIQKIDYDNNTAVTGGLEIEYHFNFNKRNWSIYTNPTYQNYGRQEKQLSLFGYPGTATAQYSFIEIPFGIRRHFVLSTKSALFIQADYGVIVPLNKDDIFSFTQDREFQENFYVTDDSGSNRSLSFGLGYSFKDSYGVVLKYYSSKEIFDGGAINGNFDGALMILFRYRVL
ncbi:porin family protein [Robertkochia sediminum]|uniref:hypothetical protein n=1 Tax=Robertkochia sediminum TaxID=2785326 RepID=UPI001933F5E6|nr:hypothetical protein [Robertkochia sediminum]MBL7472916.1 hypothetical protein [Robertkochia sediminum]